MQPARRAASPLECLGFSGLLALWFHYKPRSLAFFYLRKLLRKAPFERHTTGPALASEIETKAADSHPSLLLTSSGAQSYLFAALEKPGGCHERKVLPMAPALGGLLLDCNLQPLGMMLPLLELPVGWKAPGWILELRPAGLQASAQVSLPSGNRTAVPVQSLLVVPRAKYKFQHLRQRKEVLAKHLCPHSLNLVYATGARSGSSALPAGLHQDQLPCRTALPWKTPLGAASVF